MRGDLEAHKYSLRRKHVLVYLLLQEIVLERQKIPTILNNSRHMLKRELQPVLMDTWKWNRNCAFIRQQLLVPLIISRCINLCWQLSHVPSWRSTKCCFINTSKNISLHLLEQDLSNFSKKLFWVRRWHFGKPRASFIIHPNNTQLRFNPGKEMDGYVHPSSGLVSLMLTGVLQNHSGIAANPLEHDKRKEKIHRDFSSALLPCSQ